MDRDLAVATLLGLRREVTTWAQTACHLHAMPVEAGMRDAADHLGLPLNQLGYSGLCHVLAFFHERAFAPVWLTVSGSSHLLHGDPDFADSGRLTGVIRDEVTAVLHLSPQTQNRALKAQWGPLAALDRGRWVSRTTWLINQFADGALRSGELERTKDLRRSIFHRTHLYAALTGTGKSGAARCNTVLCSERGPIADETVPGLRDRLTLLETQLVTPVICDLWRMHP